MPTVTIPVSRLTRAGMLHKYGAEPISLSTNDVRRRELMHVGMPDKHLERKQYSLDTTITLQVNRHEYDHARRRGAEIGFFWYAQDKLRIFEFVYARVTAGLPALHAIHDYYALHGIEEDDFAIDTAERLWKRWRKENGKERLPSTPESVPRLVTVLLSVRQAKKMVQRIQSFVESGLVEMDPRHLPSIKLWVYSNLTEMTHQEVADKFDLLRPSVTRSVNRFSQYLDYNLPLRKIVAYCLTTVEARPTPSAAS